MKYNSSVDVPSPECHFHSYECCQSCRVANRGNWKCICQSSIPTNKEMLAKVFDRIDESMKAWREKNGI